MSLHNLVRVLSNTTGTGTLALGAAVSGALTFAQASVPNGAVVSYGISDGSNSEVGRGTYDSSAGTLTRDTVLASTNSGNKIVCSGNEQVFITALAEDISPLPLISGVKHKQLWIGGFRPSVTSGCAASAQLEAPTNKGVFDYLAFDAATIEKAYANIPMPDDYTGGDIYAKFYWTHPTATTNFKVSWGIQAVAISNDDTLDVAQGTAKYSNDEGGTPNDLYISPVTTAITISGSPVAGDLVNILINRKADDATNDTLAVDAYLLGVMIWYPVG